MWSDTSRRREGRSLHGLSRGARAVRHGDMSEQPTPAKPANYLAVTGGVSVILLTGFAAMAKLYQYGSGAGFIGFILVLTLIGAFALARFIARHGDEIGEARFDTTPNEPPRS